VYHSPNGALKRLSFAELNRLKKCIRLEIKRAKRAIRWLDGAVHMKRLEKKLKAQEESK